MTLKLTGKQKIEYYFIVGFALITPIIFLYDLIQIYFGNYSGTRESKELIIASLPFIILAILLYRFRKRQLRFKEFNIETTVEEFKQAIEISSPKQEWKIEKQTNIYVKAFRGPDILGSEMITIHRKPNKILINCIPNPEHRASLITFGLRKSHINNFIASICQVKQNLNEQKQNIPIVDSSENKWTFIDYILKVFGYAFCLLFIALSIFLLIPNGDYLFGILIGMIGLFILVTDLRKIIRKTANR